MQKITVKTSRPYDVYVGRGAIGFLEKYIEEQGFCGKILVITDNTVKHLHLDALLHRLPDENLHVFTIAEGEAAKTFDTYSAVLKVLSDKSFSRADMIVSFGGGSVSDIAAFCAATYLRGIRLAHVPTTLTGMCDAAIGGKCGIDFLAKNDVGTFYQPEIVTADLAFLDTLPEITFKCGMAEILKCAVISQIDTALFDDEKANVERLVFEAAAFKAKIVASDERDNLLRHVLNFGHTLGHAVEQASNYKISHGQAVAMGMSMMTKLAVKNGLAHPDMPNIVDGLIEKIGLEVDCPYSFDELKKFVLKDKKTHGEDIKLVIAPRPHEVKIISVALDSFLGGGKWTIN